MEKVTKAGLTEAAKTARTLSVTKEMIEELKNPKMVEIVKKLIDETPKGTTGNTIFIMARMMVKQLEMEV